MQEALNELFGRAVVDPQVREAYESGRVECILLECGFGHDLSVRLSGIEADDLDDFLKRVHEHVDMLQGSGVEISSRWPSDGLSDGLPAHSGDAD